MPTIDLDQVRLDYDDRGSGPAMIFLPGAHMTSALWARVTDDLSDRYRCLSPTLPMGAHRHPVGPDVDLSLAGLADLVDRFLAALDLDDVTLIGNDTGGAVAQAVVATHPGRVERLVLVSCEAFDNFPPGLPGRADKLFGRLPGGMWQAAQSMRIGAMWRLPFTFGRLAKRPLPKEIRDDWFGPLRSSRAIRRDTQRFIRSVDAAELASMTERLVGFDGPALVVWARDDRVMPLEHADRLADLLPKAGDVVWVDDSYTLVPLDQPTALAHTIGDFVSG
ncbi:MAG: alpha/beta fold hydrolase [Nocardioidaceae bacterium]